MTKPYHAGRAAHAGLMAARLAAAGMTGSPDALEHPQGFLSAVSPAGNFDATSPASGLGRTWQIVRQGLSVKKYPVCFAAHRAIDAMLDVLSKQPFKPDDVDRVTVSLSVLAAKLLRNSMPSTGLAAKFSIQFAMAAALTAGRVGLQEVTDEFVTRRDVRDIMQRVAVETNEDYDPEQPTQSRFDWVRIDCKGGAVIKSEAVHRPRGHPSSPLREQELWLKFQECVGSKRSARSTRYLFDTLRSLEQIGDVHELYRATPSRRIAKG